MLKPKELIIMENKINPEYKISKVSLATDRNLMLNQYDSFAKTTPSELTLPTPKGGGFLSN